MRVKNDSAFRRRSRILPKQCKSRRDILRWPCRMRSIFWLAGLIALLTLSGKPAYGRTQDGAQEINSWVQEHLLNPESRPPFSFVYGRQASEALLKEWPRTTAIKQLDGGRTEQTVIWTDPEDTPARSLFSRHIRELSRCGVDHSFCQRWQRGHPRS